uniref:Uncharacterized protein n=1 Tax=Spirodela intermedia TaxID=51605 RepID=A0A8S0YB52_SPIIN
MEIEKRCSYSSFGNVRFFSYQYRIEHAEQNLLHVKPARFRSEKSYGFYETMCYGSNP